MRKLLTGAVNNASQHIDKILLWKNTFQKHTNGDVILVSLNTTIKDEEALERNGIRYVKETTDGSETINNARIFHMGNFIKSIENDYDVVMYTDVFDVAFLKDPFENLDLYNYSIFIAGEGVTHGEEPWNADVMKKCYPNTKGRYNLKEVFCSGVMAGKPRELSNWVQDIWLTLLKSQKGHDIADQAAMNINVYNQGYPSLKKLFIYDKWCIHLATGGPTQFFEQWGFKQAIERKYKTVPKWNEFAIVHQFNRIPDIHKEIKKLNE